MLSGDAKALVTRLCKEISVLGSEPGWQNHFDGRGYAPGLFRDSHKSRESAQQGRADEVLTLGLDLVTSGVRQVEESDDEGETEREIADCMPVIVAALDRSSLTTADKLNWALDALLEDQFEVCEALGRYLHRRHPQTAWHTLADRLLIRLHGIKGAKGVDDFNRNHERDRLSDWAVRPPGAI